jgi:hypothetical protein
MSLQAVINNAVTIQVDRRKIAGQTISRSGLVKISSVASNVPWQITVDMSQGLKFSRNRALVEEIDRLDRTAIEVVDIGGSNPGLAYITRYQGALNSTQISQMRVASGANLTLTLNVANVTGTSGTTVIFEPGDYVQLAGNYKYPYTVTSRVLRGASSTVEVPINRPFIDQPGYTEVGASVIVGNDVTWQVVMSKKPGWRVAPGDLLQFTEAFELVEVIED